MQVTNVQDQITHAVVSKGKARELKIADTPEFFRILSSSLYSDKMLAVVREILCNAWDAHIEAGLTDMAVEVTLNNEKLTIRDFGEGIAEPRIIDIYGTYGGSTKKDNMLVTGGFGLGSKAPFAYTDHFEVTSFNMGEKTIYRMSLSSAMVGGKPSIIPVVSVPTDESGLQVSLNLKTPDDRHRFSQLVSKIVKLGGMKVKLNGILLDALPFNEAKQGFMMIRSDLMDWETQSRIRVRYGHVVYPTEAAPEYAHEYKEVTDFLDRVQLDQGSGHYYNRRSWTLVLQAAPNTVAVTPSRESLSMTETTTETIRQLLINFLKVAATHFDELCLSRTQEAIDTCIKNKTYKDLFNKRLKLLKEGDFDGDSRTITSMSQLAAVYLQTEYPEFEEYRKKDMELRVRALMNAGIGKKGMFQSYLRHFKQKVSVSNRSNWVHRRYFRWIIKNMQDADLEPKKLLAFTKVSRRYEDKDGFVPVVSMPEMRIKYQMSFLRGIVVVGHNRLDIDRVYNFPIMKDQMGKVLDLLFYQVPRTGDKAEKAKAYFNKLGLTVLDLTIRHKWEPELKAVATEAKPVAPVKKKAKGFPKLSEAIEPGVRWPSAHRLWSEDSARSEQAKFFVKVPLKEHDSQAFGGYDLSCTGAIIRLWGDQGVAVCNQLQVDKALKLGMVSVEDFVKKHMLHEFKTNKKLQAAFEQDVGDMFAHYGTPDQNILKSAWKDPILRRKFKLPLPPKSQEEDIITLWNSYTDWDKRRDPSIIECQKLREQWKVHPKILEFFNLMKASKLLTILDASDLYAVLSDTDARHWNDEHKKTARKILLLALKG